MVLEVKMKHKYDTLHDALNFCSWVINQWQGHKMASMVLNENRDTMTKKIHITLGILSNYLLRFSLNEKKMYLFMKISNTSKGGMWACEKRADFKHFNCGLVVAAGQGTQVMMLIVLCSSGNLKLKYKSWAMKMCIGAEEWFTQNTLIFECWRQLSEFQQKKRSHVNILISRFMIFVTAWTRCLESVLAC